MAEQPKFKNAEELAAAMPKMTFENLKRDFPGAAQFVRDMSATICGDSWVEPSTARLIYAQVVQKLPCENPQNNVAHAPEALQKMIKGMGYETDLQAAINRTSEETPGRPGMPKIGPYWDTIIRDGLNNFKLEKGPRDYTIAKGVGAPEP